jgi:cytochrome c
MRPHVVLQRIERSAFHWTRRSRMGDANKGSGITWDEATLKDYLKNPRTKIPGTKMSFPGLPKDEDIDNVIAYLKQFGADGKKS